MLADWRQASLSPALRATLGFVEKLTVAPASLTPADAGELRAAGVSAQAARDAIQVCYLFNTIDRLADAFAFALPEREAHDRAAKVLLKRGYAFPAAWHWEFPLGGHRMTARAARSTAAQHT